MAVRLPTQEIVNGAIENALQQALLIGNADERYKMMAQVRMQEAMAHAIVGLELAITQHGAQVSDIGPAISRVAVELGGLQQVTS